MPYDPDGLDRGAEFPLSAEQLAVLRDFMNRAAEVVQGNRPGLTLVQHDAHESSQENLRDEIMHRLSGEVFDFDIDGSLSDSETEGDYEIGPQLKEVLESSSGATSVWATIRRLEIGFTSTKRSVVISEVEFPVTVDGVNGREPSMLRVIELYSKRPKPALRFNPATSTSTR